MLCLPSDKQAFSPDLSFLGCKAKRPPTTCGGSRDWLSHHLWIRELRSRAQLDSLGLRKIADLQLGNVSC